MWQKHLLGAICATTLVSGCSLTEPKVITSQPHIPQYNVIPAAENRLHIYQEV
ncbi:MAG: hypothetical protein ACI95X_001960, partial [Paraglaciecola sp.]